MSSSYGQQEGGHRVMAAAGKLGVRYRAPAVSAEGVSRWVPNPRLATAADRDGGRDAVARGKGSGHRKKEEGEPSAYEGPGVPVLGCQIGRPGRTCQPGSPAVPVRFPARAGLCGTSAKSRSTGLLQPVGPASGAEAERDPPSGLVGAAAGTAESRSVGTCRVAPPVTGYRLVTGETGTLTRGSKRRAGQRRVAPVRFPVLTGWHLSGSGCAAVRTCQVGHGGQQQPDDPG